MHSRCVTSLFSNLFSNGPRSLWKIKWCQVHGSSVTYQKKKKRGWKRGENDGPKIIKTGNCGDLPKPILEPSCKNAIVIGGSGGFGFAAADHLLCKGARNVIIADDDSDHGQAAAEKLCNSHGKDRAHFVHYDIKSDCHMQAGLKHALCKLKVIHILLNDLDKERFPTNCPTSEKNENITTKTIRVGLKLLGKDNGGSGGIIINCASLYGFMGWPEDPFPVYCKKEPAIEVTKDFAEEYGVEETGVRLVALCPTNKQFSEIGLPDFPEPIPNKKMNKLPTCIPISKCHIGTALSYVLAWATNGSAWLVEPAFSVHQIPKLIHFPEKEGEKVDPKIYETQNSTTKTIRVGLKLLGKNNGGFGGIIINCASLYGFMGWSEDPLPVYCKKEPAIEVSKDFAEEYGVEETGVRLVALCPTNKPFSDIGLPDFPEPIPNKKMNELPKCIPIS